MKTGGGRANFKASKQDLFHWILIERFFLTTGAATGNQTRDSILYVHVQVFEEQNMRRDLKKPGMTLYVLTIGLDLLSWMRI